MIYQEFYSGEKLQPFVEKIWYCSADNLAARHLTIPFPHHELVFNFSQSYKIRKAGSEDLVTENPTAWISGLQTKAYFSESSGRHEMLGVLFKSTGLRPFVKYDSSDFYGSFVDAGLIFGDMLQGVIEKLQIASSLEAKVRVVEEFLLANLKEPHYPSYLPYSMNLLSGGLQPAGNIAELCDGISISNKSLIKTFQKHIGTSPIKYSHIQAINAALFDLTRYPAQSLTELAYRLNFYDQSHFIGVFKSVTSLTPSQYVTHVLRKEVDAASPNFISLG